MSKLDDIAKTLQQDLSLAAGDARNLAQAVVTSLGSNAGKSLVAVSDAITSCMAKLKVGAGGKIVSAIKSGDASAALAAAKSMLPGVAKAALGTLKVLRQAA